ncbi:MAG TPA: tetratricopeptide repeat protein [Candidatus Latescibacteria bacterium]|nr:hypothetical protein [Gemmatimonadaceae bacterium]MDP6016015.1 tetratricopeptide repeat protein [Candidatus Latescibacterota bacterium]HJP31091.1 tetratricopeptide repeat protein [Candidatus Latescibacterota bacterium]
MWASDLALWQDAVDRGPRMARSHLYLGDARVAAARREVRPEAVARHREGARSAYEAVVTLDPVQRMLTLQAHNGLAILETEAGDLSGAEGRLARVLAEHPDFVDALVNLGGVFYARAGKSRGADGESLERATQLYERALDLAPNRYEARLNLGACYHLAGDLARAQAEYETVVGQAPDSGTAALNLGLLYLHRSSDEPTGGWRQRARGQLQRAVRLLPGNASARRALEAAQETAE